MSSIQLNFWQGKYEGFHVQKFLTFVQTDILQGTKTFFLLNTLYLKLPDWKNDRVWHNFLVPINPIIYQYCILQICIVSFV